MNPLQVRYKTGKFSHPVPVTPGDTFSCNLHEEVEPGVMRTQTVTEEITKPMVISHWVTFYIPAVNSLGGIFGGEEVVARIGDVFKDAVEIPKTEPLMGA